MRFFGCADPGLENARAGPRRRNDFAPRQLVGKKVRTTGGEISRRFPISDDVVMNLVVRRNLDELDEPVAPRSFGFDPDTRTPLIVRLEIFEIAERSVALPEPETHRTFVHESADLQCLGVIEWPPDTLSAAVYHRQALAVVDGGAEVV